MSRRHKIEETENPLAKTTTESNNFDRFSFLVDLIRYSERKIHETINKTFDGCSKIWTGLFSGCGVIGMGHVVSERKREENIRNTLAMMDIEIKQDKPQDIVEDICQKKIDSILNIDKIKEDDKPKRGRPIIKRLCEKISDCNVVKMIKKTHTKLYHKPIELCDNVTKYLVCSINSLFGISNNDTETVYGKVSHFHRIMSSIKGLKIPSVRRLQQMLKWFMEWKEAVIKTAKEMKEEITHRAWEELVEKIKRQFEILIPQYAMC